MILLHMPITGAHTIFSDIILENEFIHYPGERRTEIKHLLMAYVTMNNTMTSLRVTSL